MKLSRSQRNVLGAAYAKLKSDQIYNHFGLVLHYNVGWFYPQHTTRGSIELFSRWQTCASLCALGLFEYRPFDTYWKRGKFVHKNEYRITEAGINHLKALGEVDALGDIVMTRLVR